MSQQYLIAKGWFSGLIAKSIKWQIGVIAQGLWSVASFFVTIYLARSLPVQEFGGFAIGITVRQLFLMVLSALALSPMIVISSRRVNNERKDPLLAVIVFGFEVVMFFSFFLAAMVNWSSRWPAVEFTVFLFGGLAVELQRRINFVHYQISKDFFGGLIAIGGSIGSLFLLRKLGIFTLPNSFLMLGAVNLLWAIFCGSVYWLRPSINHNAKELIELWEIGRWGLGTNLTGYAYTQVSTYLTLGFIGTAGVAVLELGRQLVLPIQVLLVGAANLWQTRLARSAVTNPPTQFMKEVWRITWIQTFVGAVLLLIILLFSPFLIPWLVPGKEQTYSASIIVAWILSGGMILQLLWQHHSFGVVALGKPEYGFFTKSVAFLFLVPIGYQFTKQWGLIGAAWSRVFGEFIVLALSIVMLRRAASACENDKFIVDGLKQISYPTDQKKRTKPSLHKGELEEAKKITSDALRTK